MGEVDEDWACDDGVPVAAAVAHTETEGAEGVRAEAKLGREKDDAGGREEAAGDVEAEDYDYWELFSVTADAEFNGEATYEWEGAPDVEEGRVSAEVKVEIAQQW